MSPPNEMELFIPTVYTKRSHIQHGECECLPGHHLEDDHRHTQTIIAFDLPRCYSAQLGAATMRLDPEYMRKPFTPATVHSGDKCREAQRRSKFKGKRQLKALTHHSYQ